jgi:hypothetical protein
VNLTRSRNPTAILILLCAVVCLPQTPQSHTPLDNQRVSALSRSDLSTDELVRIIMTAPEVNFELSPGSTDALTKAGVKDEVIRAMAARANGKAYTPAAAQAPVPERSLRIRQPHQQRGFSQQTFPRSQGCIPSPSKDRSELKDR